MLVVLKAGLDDATVGDVVGHNKNGRLLALVYDGRGRDQNDIAV